jgi:hypothetical protein
MERRIFFSRLLGEPRPSFVSDGGTCSPVSTEAACSEVGWRSSEWRPVSCANAAGMNPDHWASTAHVRSEETAIAADALQQDFRV